MGPIPGQWYCVADGQDEMHHQLQIHSECERQRKKGEALQRLGRPRTQCATLPRAGLSRSCPLVVPLLPPCDRRRG